MPNINKSIADYIECLASEFDSQIAITYYHRFRSTTYTYRQIYELALKCSVFFYEKGIIKGDRILIYGDNCPEWVVVLLSCALTGIILVPIDSKSPPEFVEKIRKETDAKWVISDASIPSQNTVLDHLFSIIEAHDSSLFFKKRARLSRDDIFEILYTSGTTAAPKGAVIRHRNFIASIWGLREHHLVCNKNCRFLSMLPLSHVLEQNGGCLSVLRFGGQIVYAKQVRFARIVEILIQEKITHIVSVPAILKRFQNKIVEESETGGTSHQLKKLLHFSQNLPTFLRRLLSRPLRQKIGPHLQAFLCGGAPLNLSTETFWENLGIKVIQGYGLTESCAMSCINTFNHRQKGSVGKPIPNQTLTLGKDNEILLRGDNIISEYYNAPELNREYFRDGWYHTGDVGRWDDEGNLYIVGRLKEMILTSNGLNVFPTDIEEILNNMEGIKESAVFEDPLHEGKLLAGIILENQEIDTHITLEKTNRQLATHQHLSQLIPWFHPYLPKTVSLKIKRNELPKIYEQYSTKKVSVSQPQQDPLLHIIAEICRVPASGLAPETTLVKNLNFDSLNLVDLVIRLESQFRVDIDEAQLNRDCSIQQLRKLIIAAQKIKKPPRLSPFYWSRSAKIIRRILRMTMEGIIRRWIKIEVVGVIPEIPKNRPTIFIANHTSHLDTFSILGTVPSYFKYRIAIAAAYDYFFGEKKKRSFFMNPLLIPMFPFHRDDYFSENLKNMGELLKSGQHLLIFPEGTRSRNGTMASFKPGIGMIVKEMNAQVVPIHIDGAYQLWPSSASYPKKGKIQVRYGKPISFDSTFSPETITSTLETHVRELASKKTGFAERDERV